MKNLTDNWAVICPSLPVAGDLMDALKAAGYHARVIPNALHGKAGVETNAAIGSVAEVLQKAPIVPFKALSFAQVGV